MNMTTDKTQQPNWEAMLDNAHKEIARLKRDVDDSEIVRMSKIYMEETIDLAKQNASAFKILMLMVSKMTKTNALMISNESLEKLTGSSNSTIKRAVRHLREEGWLDVLKAGSSNIYRINSDIFWNETRTGKWAEFPTHVVSSFDEQDEITKNRVPGRFTRQIPLVLDDDYSRSRNQRMGSDGQLNLLQPDAG
ncbi:helix-turn-helix domain-containing protein [Massilia sp. CCM 8734]|uniref:helix-turn-helix domain-containing protein n=1 Tax=Massilia sp. CCM 8734 TaxID=2609283 RepID=UPI00142196F8|nr:helix-turn-helix domain-containing protein [Massilia sp. CCM 8734]NHZ99077.1 hypothetical protein [Massilia sp. CCM 8734]